MELKECITCGSHSFTDNKCDYCGNEYDSANENKIFYGNLKQDNIEEVLDSFNDKKGNEIAFKIMIIILVSIIWFAITVFIPPLFIITIILLTFYGAYRLTKISK